MDTATFADCDPAAGEADDADDADGAEDAAGLGEAALTAPACAAHTDAPVAATTTASAAPTVLPYQPRPPL
ncbi:hypothetical protein GCM10020256_12570 [Streptomyces thermocoprophilus]